MQKTWRKKQKKERKSLFCLIEAWKAFKDFFALRKGKKLFTSKVKMGMGFRVWQGLFKNNISKSLKK